jgi:hypothetical protein
MNNETEYGVKCHGRQTDLSSLIKETSGIYPEIDAEKESGQLREDWCRHE